MILRRLIRELRVKPRERTYVRRFQNAQDHHLGQNYTRDMHARRPFKMSHQRIMVARRDTRSRSCMRALQRIQSGCPVHPEPGHGSRTSAAHSMRIIEGQSGNHVPTAQWAHQTSTGREAAQTPLTAASTARDTTCTRSGRQRPARTIHGGSRVACRLDHRQDLRGLSNARRQLLVVLGLRERPPSRSCAQCAEQVDQLADRDGADDSGSSISPCSALP